MIQKDIREAIRISLLLKNPDDYSVRPPTQHTHYKFLKLPTKISYESPTDAPTLGNTIVNRSCKTLISSQIAGSCMCIFRLHPTRFNKQIKIK